jgi:PKD repeat protein
MRRKNRVLPAMVVLSLTATLLLVQGCERSGLPGGSSVTARFADFHLTPITDSLPGGGFAGTFSLAPRELAGEKGFVAIQVFVAQARALKAAYFRVDYDSARFSPARIEAGPALQDLAETGQLLELYYTKQPGSVHCGQCLANWDVRDGFSGDGLVATLFFRQQPYTESRATSAPPDTARSQTQLSWDEPSSTLSWRFYSQGDYNQNGLVGITDLTPLGMLFGQTLTYPGGLDTAKAVVDGNGDAQLNVGDLAPIGINYDKSLQGGWNIWGCVDTSQYPSDPTDDNGTATFVANVGLEAFDPSTARATDRLLYTYKITAPQPGEVYWVRPLDDGLHEGIASNYAPGGGTTNHAPVAVISTYGGTGSGAVGTAPHHVDLDGQYSSDEDGDTITSYEWDYENDGVVDADTEFIWHIFTDPGTYTVKLTVSDGSLTGEATTSIVVEPAGTWHIQTLASDGDSGRYCSLASVGGCPAIAYSYKNGDYSELRYIYSTDISGIEGSWSAPETVSSSSSNEFAARCISLAEIGTDVVVAFDEGPYPQDDSPGPFFCVGRPWSVVFPMVDVIGTGSYCTLMLSGGIPRLAYTHFDSVNSLSSAWCLSADDSSGELWSSPQVQIAGDLDHSRGSYLSFAEINGLLAAAFHNDNSPSGIGFAIAADSIPSAFNYAQVHDQGYNWAGVPTLLQIANRAGIAFIENVTGPPMEGNVMFALADDAGGLSWTTPPQVVYGNTAAPDLTMAVIDGQPAVAFHLFSGELIYIRSEYTMMCNGTYEVVDSGGPPEGMADSRMREFMWHPCIAYYDYGNKDLKFASRY